MIKILYLHGLEANLAAEKQKLLESTFGKENVKAPNLKTQQTATIFTISVALTCLAFLGLTIYAFVRISITIGIVVLIVSAIVCSLLYLLAGRGATHIMLKLSISIAEKAFKSFRPNVIVASSFGAVTALQMDVPKCALLLLAPVHDQYTRYMKIQKEMSIKEYPYVLIVHGCNDTVVPIDDSIRLIETSTIGKCRLEVIDDDNRLQSISSDDMRCWVEEVHERGMQEAMVMAQEGNKHVDLTLFNKTL